MAEEKNNNRLSSILSFIPKNEVKEKDILEYPEAECILKHIEKKLKDKRDYKTLFSGGVGNGKSYGGLRLLELHYLRRFNEKFPLSHIVSNLAEAVLTSKNFKRKGEGLLIEEISTSAGSRDSNTTQNKLWNKFLDTCRIKQIVLVMNCPHISFVDKHIRMSLNSWIDCKIIDFKRKIVQARPLWLQTSPHKSEPYKHHFINDDGEEIDICYFKKPSDYISEPYDKQKEIFTDELYSEIHFRMIKDRKDKLKKLGMKFLSPRELEAYNLWLTGYNSNEGKAKMNFKSLEGYNKVLREAKNKLKTPEYAHQYKILDKNQQIPNKNHKTTAIT